MSGSRGKASMAERTFGCAREMPALRHSTTDPFDVTKSEVAMWLCSQPSVLQRVFDMATTARDGDGMPFISYDPESKAWKGASL